MLNEIRMSLDDVLKCGSSLEMSPPWAVTSSFLVVVCAPAGPPSAGASAAAAPTVAADFRRSRLVSWLIGSSLSGTSGPGALRHRRCRYSRQWRRPVKGGTIARHDPDGRR